MNLDATEVIPLIISAIVGAGAFVTKEKQGFSIFRRDSCMGSLYVLAVFNSVWVVGVSLVVAVLGEYPKATGESAVGRTAGDSCGSRPSVQIFNGRLEDHKAVAKDLGLSDWTSA